ncbi:MAG: acyl-CoA dehydrogenase family protein [Burkholderiales bacterium]|nr:acyl-CoA dehydrogenase family protein [Burkholderiales bacterium]
MDARFSDEENAFRAEVRAFLQQAWTPELAARVDDDDSYPQAIGEWQRRLFERGWVAPGWPRQHGGCEWTPTQRYLYELERSAIGAPEVPPFGIKMVGPVIIQFGNAAQQARFLPRILRAQDWWCQGYSEPGAGSDLASLKTRAERAGDHYIVNGQKIWTTYAQHADWMFCLVRTDHAARRQDGISFLLIDMKTPGIRVQPIVSIDGVHSLNEVFFDNVRVPVDNLVGEQDRGWTYAKSLLAHERTAIAGVGDSKRRLRRLRQLAQRETCGGKPLAEDPILQARLADIEIELMALETMELRALFEASKGKGPGPESSLLKIKGSEVQQAIQAVMMELAGLYGAVLPGGLDAQAIGHDFGDEARRAYMYGRAATIYGGSNEVQKNITAKAVLGL